MIPFLTQIRQSVAQGSFAFTTAGFGFAVAPASNFLTGVFNILHLLRNLASGHSTANVRASEAVAAWKNIVAGAALPFATRSV